MFHKTIYPVVSVLLLVATLTSCGSSGLDAPTGTESGRAKLLSISVSPDYPVVAKNTDQTFTATGIYSDSTTKDLTASVVWSTSDSEIVEIVTESAVRSSPEFSPPTTKGGGHAYGKNYGSTTITATSGSTTGSTTVTVASATLVSLAITPTNPSIAPGTGQQFRATGTLSDNTMQDLTSSVMWSSSNTAVATISPLGMAASIAAGSTTVKAMSGSIWGSATLAVTSISGVVPVTITYGIEPPTTHADGTPVMDTEIAGYKIYYGLTSGSYTNSVDIGNTTSSTQTFNLESGHTYYFAATAYFKTGGETGFSYEQTKVVN